MSAWPYAYLQFPSLKLQMGFSMNTLNFTSCMAENADLVGKLIADYAATKLSMPTQFIIDIPWQERERQFDSGAIQVCWICGLPYIWKADNPHMDIELLAAPVLKGTRYHDHPVYFSDIVVHQNSQFQKFSDLEGSCWAYNEPHSHSGCYVMRYHLAMMGKDDSFFGQVVESGAHQKSLQMLLNHEIDVAAIDSSVLEMELKHFPEIQKHIRIIDTLGPSPMPPWVISQKVPKEIRSSLRRFLLELHQDPVGRDILEKGEIAHFAEVKDSDYDPIRQMTHKAEEFGWCKRRPS